MYHSLIQILAAARLIARPQGATKAELAKLVGVSERTAYRLVQALEGQPPEGLGYPIYDEPGPPTRWKLNMARDRASHWLPVPSEELDLEDRVILEWLISQEDANPALAPALDKLRRKIGLLAAAGGIAVVPKESGAGPRPSGRPVLLHSARVPKEVPPQAPDILRRLVDAISRRTVCSVTYEAMASGQKKTYDIHPLALFEQDGGMYLYIWVPYYRNLRILALERIRALEPRDQTFELPKDLDLEARLEDPFGMIQGESFTARIRFSPRQAPYIRERAWPGDYRMEDLPDGGLVLTVHTAGAWELSRWILSQGSAAVVLEPDWLREDIARELGELLGNYEN